METKTSSTPLQLNLILKVQPVTLESEDGPVDCRLYELTGESRDEYMNLVRTRTDARTKTVKDFKAVQANLIRRALKRVDEDGEEKDFTINEIQNFPASAITALYKAAIELSGLDEKKEDDEEGND